MSETTNLKLFKHDNPSTNTNQFDVNKALNNNWDKLDNFAGEVNDKVIEIEDNIEELQQKTGQIEENILSIEKGQTNQNTEIKNLQQEVQELEQDVKANAITEETEQAKSLKITEASGARGSLKVLGNDEQDGEPSLNSSVPIKCLGSNINLYPGWEKNTISSETGEPEIDPNYIRSVDFISVLPNKNYTIKAYNIEEFGDLNTAARMYDINKNYLSSKWIGSILSNSLTFTLTNADVRYVKIVSSNNSAVTDTAKVDIKLEEGEVATTYSPFEQGSTEIKKINDNLYKNDYITNSNVEYSFEDKEIKITNTDKVTQQINSYGRIYLTIPNFIKNQTYKFKCTYNNSNSSASNRVRIFKNNESQYFVDKVNLNEFSFVAEDTTLKFEIYSSFNTNASNTLTIENLMIATNVAKYIEHQEENYILDIQQEMLKGDYFDLETKEEVHCNGKAILNGTEAWAKSRTLSTDNFAMFYTNRGNIVSSGEVKSNALKYVKDYQTQDTYVTSVGEAINIRIATEIIGGNTVELFKTFLQNRYNEGKAIEVYYKRSTPARIPLNAEQIEVLEKLNKLRFFEGTNNIITTEDIALLQAIYPVNLKNVNNKMQEEIDEIKELLSTTQTSAMLLDNLEQDLIKEVE